MHERVILIGLDGLGWDELNQLGDIDTMPNIYAVGQEGLEESLSSTHPPWTPCAWPSLLSGRNPGKHGVFDFFTRDGYDKRLIERDDVDAPYLFEAVDAHDRTSIVVNYPVTHPASRLDNGAVIPGYLASEDVSFYPEHLRDEYENEYGYYRIYPEYGTDDDAVEEYVDVARCRRDMACFLDERYDWDLMAVQFQVTDSVFHDLDDRNKIRRVLEKVDEFVGDIVDTGGDDATVLIASDHGMGDYDWTFYANSWLTDHGYCETTAGDPQYFRQAKDELKGKDKNSEEDSLLETTVKAAASAASMVGLSPQRIHHGLSTVGLADTIERLLPEDALVAAQNQVVDYSNSAAFQLYFNSLGIHLNVEGRDPAGTIPQTDYEEVRAQLIEDLKCIRDPDGELIFDSVRPREEVYEGEHLDDAPDIALFPRDYQYDVSGSILDTFRRYPHKNHKPEGIILSNRTLDIDKQPDIHDIAPTVAAALCIPVDSNTDGKVLLDRTETVERQNWDEIADKYANRQSKENSSNVEERLADLGYME